MPLGFYCCLRAVHRGWPPLRLGLTLGLLLTLQFGISQEIFATSIVFGAILLTIFALIRPDLRLRVVRLLPGLGIAMAVCVVLTVPFTWQMIRRYGSGMASLSSPASGSSDLLGFFIPTPITLIGGHAFALLTRHFVGGLEEQGAYFGLPLLVLTAHIASKGRGDVAVRCTGLLAACAVVLSLGPFVHVLGFTISTAPWIAVSWLPFLKAMLPIRFVIYAWLAVAMMLARWLAAPDAGRRRSIIAAGAILFLMPDPGVARHWTPVHIPDAFAVRPAGHRIPKGSRILILPEWGEALGYQVSSGMDVSLVGQGYLSSGMPQPFARWHLFPSLFGNKFSEIDPREFAAYLGAYRVDFVAVLRPTFINSLALDDAATNAAHLLGAAGWQMVWTTADVTVFRPGPASRQPTEEEIAADTTMPSAGGLAKMIKRETSWVCGIQTVAHLTDINAAPFLSLYVDHAHPPLPAGAIRCR
ncbi:MAG TPA: hypothetical protein VMB73_02240 [Acetobacteraceae bacterium]|nr:hypothetical protein [Acetobacteraceae bacterium]